MALRVRASTPSADSSRSSRPGRRRSPSMFWWRSGGCHAGGSLWCRYVVCFTVCVCWIVGCRKCNHWKVEFFKCQFLQVTVGQQSTTGTGPNKKLAKRAAAESLLQLLGYSRYVGVLPPPSKLQTNIEHLFCRPSLQPNKPAIKSNEGEKQEKGKKVGIFLFFYIRSTLSD